MTTEHDETDSPIDDYLDQLVTVMSTHPPRRMRRLLAEAETHLRDDAEVAQGRGLPGDEAERQAVIRFGSAGAIAAADRACRVTPWGMLLRQILGSTLLLGGLGAVAVGVSGLLAGLLRLIADARFLAGPVPGRALAVSDCAQWLGIDPSAGSCQAAATADWANETVYHRIALGVLGVIALLLFRWLTRGAPRRLALSTLNHMVSDTVAATLFAAAGILTLGLAVDTVAVASGNGAGQWLSAAPVAFAAAGLLLTAPHRRPQ